MICLTSARRTIQYHLALSAQHVINPRGDRIERGQRPRGCADRVNARGNSYRVPIAAKKPLLKIKEIFRAPAEFINRSPQPFLCWHLPYVQQQPFDWTLVGELKIPVVLVGSANAAN